MGFSFSEKLYFMKFNVDQRAEIYLMLILIKRRRFKIEIENFRRKF